MLLLWQLVLAGYTAVLGNHAAREAARELAVSTLRDDALIDAPRGRRARRPAAQLGAHQLRVTLPEDDRVRVSLRVPLLVPGLWTRCASAFEQETAPRGRSARGRA